MKIEDNLNTLFAVKISDNLRGKISEAVSKGGKIKNITVKMEATHSGKPNGNFWIYTPYGMKAGHKSFVTPVYKPVTREHEENSKTLGRVIKSDYVEYSDITPEELKRPFDKSYMKDYKKFMSSKQYKDPKFKGLGHVELTAKITDPDAIKKVLDNQYGFVSVGGGVKSANCSICGSPKGVKNTCEHSRGFKYNGETCYYVGGIMNFEHISYVDTPADKNATSTLIRDSENNKSHLQILDFEIEKGTAMTIKIEDFDKSNDSLVQHAQELGIKDYQLPSDEGLTILDYVFGDEKTFPIADKTSALVAYDFIKTKIKDSEDKEAVIKVIQDKLDEFGIEDAEQGLKDILSEQESKIEDSKESTQSNIDLEALANLVAEKIKDSINVGGSQSGYLETQRKLLTAEVKALTVKNKDLETMLKDSLVSQICSIEKISDSDKIDSLKKRSLVSLRDKLEDLQSLNIEDSKGEKQEDDKEEKTLPKDGLKVEDSADGVENTDAKDKDDKKIEDSIGKVEFQSRKDFDTAYIKVLKSEGLEAAKKLKLSAVIKK